MPGLERPGRRAGGERLEHRGLDFEETLAVHEAPHRGHHRRAAPEHLAGARVPEEIQIALPVAGVAVGEAVPLLGQRQQGLRQEDQRVRPHGEFVGPGPEHGPGHAHPVPEVERLRDREVALGEHVAPDVDLERSRPFGKAQERGLAERPDRNDPAAHAHGPLRLRDRFEPRPVQIAERLRRLLQGVGGGEPARPGRNAELFDLGQLPAAVPLVPVHGRFAVRGVVAHVPSASGAAASPVFPRRLTTPSSTAWTKDVESSPA